MRRKPLAYRLRTGRKRRSFPDAEQKARTEQRTKSGCKRPTKRGHAPQAGPDATHAAHAEPVQHHAYGQLAQPVGEVVRTGKVAIGDIGNAERDDQRRVGRGQVHAIKVADQYSDAKKPGDPPATSRNPSQSARCLSGQRPVPRYSRAFRWVRW